VGAKTLLYAPEILGTLSPLLAATEDLVTPIVSEGYDDILSQTKVLADAYPFDATFEEVRDVPFLGLHTSGTSGHPKPIYWTHAALATMASIRDPEVHDEAVWGPNSLYTLLGKGTLCNAFPSFHVR
jgi:acyl-coenzyme A synthetase/AMP-(fatty) acid ligase